MAVTAAPEIAARIRVVRYRERFITCGCCRGAAVGMVLIDGERWATTCQRHVDTWLRRAVQHLTKQND